MTDRAARNLLIALTIAVAATRVVALSHSMWDWDEALFSMGVQHYNVANHNPHPPGFPLFIAAAKLVRLFVHDDFRALRTLNLIVSLFIFPAAYAFGRACGLGFRPSAIGALLYAFLPNVVYFGGTAMSDISASVMFLAGGAFLLRDASARSFFVGSAIFAASMLIRPQNVIGAYPWIAAAVRQSRARGRRGVANAAAGAALVVVIVAGGYGLAAWRTGWSDYMNATRWHQQYVRTVDGYANPSRQPSLSNYMLNRFIMNPLHARGFPALTILAALAIFIPRRSHLQIAATFLPQAVFVLFMLNPSWVSRFSVAYLAGYTLLAASAIDIIVTTAIHRVPQIAAAAAWAIGAAGVIGSAAWAWPSIREVRRHDSPPVEAMRWVTRNLARDRAVIYVHGSMGPFADYFLPDYHKVPAGDDFESSPGMHIAQNAYYIADHPAFGTSILFQRKHTANLERLYPRYYEASVAPIDMRVTFGPGWYAEESDGRSSWRWMHRSAHLFLASTGKRAKLKLRLYAPIDIEAPPVLTVRMNGAVVDEFKVATPEFERSYDLAVPAATTYDMSLEVDHAVVPSRANRGTDARELGLKLRAAEWQPLP